MVVKISHVKNSGGEPFEMSKQKGIYDELKQSGVNC